MKKIYNILLLAVMALGFAACSDVPAPYEVNPGTSTFGKKLPYKSANLNTGWTTVVANGYENNPWSMGSSYVQASSSQKWDGTNRSNKEVCGYLISPAINTTCTSGKVKMSFDMCIGYSSYDKNYKDHIGLFISKDYDGSNYSTANWTKLDFTYPSTAVNSSWALESTNEIQIPDEFVNHDSVYISFYFYGSSSGSATWEMENFLIQEGDASESSADTTSVDPTPTPSGEAKGSGTASDPYNVAAVDAFTSAGSYSNSSPSPEVYVKGIVSQIGSLNSTYGELNYYISDDGTTSNQFYVYNGYGLNGEKITSADYLKVGDVVVICGKTVTYNGTNEFTYGSKIISINGGGGSDTPDTPTGSDGVKIDSIYVTLTNSAATAGSESETIDLSAQGWENAAEVTSVSGTNCTIAFSAGENTKYPPKFYTATGGVRVYANNTITFTGNSKAIAKIVMTCDEYNGTQYVGQTTATVTFSGNTAVYTNYGTGTTQLRVKTIAITYAK